MGPTTTHLLDKPVWQEWILGVPVDGVGHVSAGLPAEQVNHTERGEVMMSSPGFTHKWKSTVLFKLIQLTWDCLRLLHASQKTGNHSKSSYRLLVSSSCIHSVESQSKGENWFCIYHDIHKFYLIIHEDRMTLYLDKMGNLRYVKGLHRNDHSFMISKACYDTRNSGQKRLGPPFQQFEPKDRKSLKHFQQTLCPSGDVSGFYLWKLLRCLGVQISADVFNST